MAAGEGWRFGPPKTAASVRVVPMPNVVKDALAAHLAEFPAGDDRFLFTNDVGQPVRRSGFNRTWQAAVTTAAKDENLNMPSRVRLHELRHFYASLLIRHGESVKVVQVGQERLGHASAKETLDAYCHLWPDSEDRTRAAIDAVLGGSRVTGVSRSDVG